MKSDSYLHLDLSRINLVESTHMRRILVSWVNGSVGND